MVKHCCQAMLTAQWTHRLPVIQAVSPAEMAADVIQRALGGIEDIEDEEYTIIDFCSGAGGEWSRCFPGLIYAQGHALDDRFPWPYTVSRRMQRPF